jgi:hypothetical protein
MALVGEGGYTVIKLVSLFLHLVLKYCEWPGSGWSHAEKLYHNTS